MKKVCHVADELSIGGIERTVIAIATGLRGYEHEIWCLRSRGQLAKEAERQGVVVREFGAGVHFDPSVLMAVAAGFRRGRFDIVHCHGMYPSITGRVAAILAGISVKIAHCQNLYTGTSRKVYAQLRVLSRFTDVIIAVSEAVRRSLIEDVGLDDGKIAVIYNSAGDISPLDGVAREAVRSELGIVPGAFVITCMGRLEEHKGVQFALEAVARLARERPNVACLVIGDGPVRRELENGAAARDLAGRAVFTGFRRDTERFLAASDVFVQPSTVREGLPLVLAEAASAALPLIATPVGGNVEIVGDGANGFIVPVKDAETLAARLRVLIDDGALRRTMGMRSRQVWTERFTAEKMIISIREVYDRYARR